MTVQQRRAKRKQFGKDASIDFGDGSPLYPCEVTDISDGGARLVILIPTEWLPERFSLWLSPTGSVRRECRLAWRGTAECGVQFLKAGGR